MLTANSTPYYSGTEVRPPAADILAALLQPGENIAYVATIGLAAYWKAAAMALLAVAAAFWSLNLALYFLLVGGVLFLIAWRTRRYLLLGATDRRILCRAGLLYSESTSIHYNAVESVDIFTPFLGALLGYSNVIITGTGRLGFVVPYVADAAQFRAAVEEQMARAAPRPAGS